MDYKNNELDTICINKQNKLSNHFDNGKIMAEQNQQNVKQEHTGMVRPDANHLQTETENDLNYKNEFIEFLVRCGVLTFGDFVTKSGRKTPYFVNTGNYRSGAELTQLGRFYARLITEKVGDNFDNLYGPAYKGIPLAVTTAIALAELHSHDVTVSFNRKEAKDHGEGGTIIGHRYDGSEQVVIIEDVITAGTSLKESMAILAANNNPKVAALVVSVDRMERSSGELTALAQAAEDFNLPVYAIVTVRDIINHLYNRKIDGKVYIDDHTKASMEAYLQQYGPTG